MNKQSIKSAAVIILITVIALLGCSSTVTKTEIVKKKADVVDYRATGILAKSLPEIAKALNEGEITSEELVQLYLDRIDAVDKNGPTLQTILTLNPDVLADAKKLDQMRAAGITKGLLHGVPILLKDNIESKDNMPTTAGALALKENVTGRDSPLVAGLRSQGAVILGKANLSQWAYMRSEGAISGWTVLGGQVRNPHMLDRNPCGSSSGSGAAAAASLASGTVGTETDGSVICPSSANGIVGFKPTVGIVPQLHIIPISASQDTAGPMTKTVMGAAMLMNAMATETPEIDYTSALNNNALKGVRVGVLNFAKGGFQPIHSLFYAALKDLAKAGAILVDINEPPSKPNDFYDRSYDLLKYEFKAGVNTYLASTSPNQVKTRTLKELIAFNEEHADVELTLFDQSIFLTSDAMGSLDTLDYKESVNVVQKATREDGIDSILQEHNVEVLVAPSGHIAYRTDPVNGDIWPRNLPGFGSYAAIAGYPHASVPMGGIRSLPVGLSFIGGKNTDAEILAYAYAYEQHSLRRLDPKYLRNAEDIPAVAKAMKPYSED